MALGDRIIDNPSLSKSSAEVHGYQTSMRSTLVRELSSTSSKASQNNESDQEITLTAISPITQVARHLKPPKSFYPLQYGRKLRDMEVWDNMFVDAATGYPAFTPPERIPPQPLMLDLACGYGYWCILAARFFEDSRIVGMDIADIQPDLARVGHGGIAERISWVHGDILEKLPFPDCHFDFIRTLHIEFCVPEHKVMSIPSQIVPVLIVTEWGKLFEEIVRVLKPGGIFETAQESMTFPCPRFPPRTKPLLNVAAVNAWGHDRKCGVSNILADSDPRDHSRLKAAFDAMIEVRFLNPQIISTLPFYMELQFDSFKMTPTFHAMLPPSSFVRDTEDPTSGTAAEPGVLAQQQINVPGMLLMEPQAVNTEVISHLGGQMHLNQTLTIGLSCKEAMWEQFEVFNPTLTRTDFDYLMKNWELDMRDRIDMRGVLKAGLKWKIPPGEEDPDRKAWREETLRFHQEDGPWDARPLPEYCRSIRAFCGTKQRPR